MGKRAQFAIPLLNLAILLCAPPAHAEAPPAHADVPPAHTQEPIAFVQQTCAELRPTLATLNQPLLPGKHYDSRELSRWFLSPLQHPKAVALVIHGLNFRPSSMNSVVHALNTLGVNALRLSLTGHRGNSEEMKYARADRWLTETLQGYCVAKAHADVLGVPLVFAGFSAGGLLGETLMAFNGKETLNFKAALLFAPALVITKKAQIMASTLNLPKAMPFISLSPAPYRMNNWPRVAQYYGLFDTLAYFKLEQAIPGLAAVNIPTAVFINRGDMTVSYSGIQKLIKDQNLDRWRVYSWSTGNDPNDKPTLRHIVVDEAMLGLERWNFVTTRMTELLDNALR